MSDQQLVAEGYEQIIKTVFSQFYQASVLARTSEEKAKRNRSFKPA